jgi:fatty acid desaturase
VASGPPTTQTPPARGRVPWRWAASLALHLGLLVAGIAFADRWPGAAGLWLAALAAGFASVQLGYLAHDLDHGHVTGNRRWLNALGLLCWNFLLGVSHDWWRDKHRRHHLDTHLPGRDPDLYALFGHEVASARALRGAHRWFVARQHWLFWPVTAFARIYFQALSLSHAVRLGGRRALVESCALLAHHAVFWGIAWSLLGTRALAFGAVVLIVSGLYMGLAFATNHLGVPHAPGRGRGTLWQAAHTRNIRCGRLGDYLLGGLNLQIEHHVYPWLPRARLRAARAGVQARCAAAGLPYREAGLWSALIEVQRELARVARAARAA